MVSPVTQIESLYKRLEKARALVTDGRVHPVVGMDSHYVVQGNAGYYLVICGHEQCNCTCLDHQQRQDVHHGWCKHRIAVAVYQESQAQAQAPVSEAPANEEMDRMAAAMRANGHHVPGDPSPIQDDRPLEEQIKDLF